eukprot:11018009-Lingulodinium_polyedra.AAC.1
MVRGARVVRGARPPARPIASPSSLASFYSFVRFLPGGVFRVMYISRSIAANGRGAGHGHQSGAAGAQP